MALAQDLKNLGGRLEVIGEDLIGHVEAIAGSSEGRLVLADLAAMSRFTGLPAGTIAGLGAPLRAFVGAVAPAASAG